LTKLHLTGEETPLKGYPLRDSAPVYQLRLPGELDRELRARAKAEGRTLRSLIIELLEDGVEEVVAS
jgi:hypothetical protein